MSSILKLLNLYFAMAVYYILKLPYAIQVIISVTLLFSLFCLCLSLIRIFWLYAKKLFYWLLPFGIIFLQGILYKAAKLIPVLRNKAENLDDDLNHLGLNLGPKPEKDKEPPKDIPGKKNIKKYLFRFTFIAAVIFLILPYYIEPLVKGNAKDICREMAGFGVAFQEKAQDFANKHYNPQKSVKSGRAKKSGKKKHVLHLGKEGEKGTYLRSSPKLKKDNIITTVSGDVKLYYENQTKKEGKRVWLKVSTKDVPKAWVSKNLIRKKDLQKAGIK